MSFEGKMFKKISQKGQKTEFYNFLSFIFLEVLILERQYLTIVKIINKYLKIISKLELLQVYQKQEKLTSKCRVFSYVFNCRRNYFYGRLPFNGQRPINSAGDLEEGGVQNFLKNFLNIGLKEVLERLAIDTF